MVPCATTQKIFGPLLATVFLTTVHKNKDIFAVFPHITVHYEDEYLLMCLLSPEENNTVMILWKPNNRKHIFSSPHLCSCTIHPSTKEIAFRVFLNLWKVMWKLALIHTNNICLSPSEFSVCFSWDKIFHYKYLYFMT